MVMFILMRHILSVFVIPGSHRLPGNVSENVPNRTLRPNAGVWPVRFLIGSRSLCVCVCVSIRSRPYVCVH